MEISKPTFQEHDSDERNILEGLKKSPFLVAGILAFSTICGIGAYKWKRSKMDRALFLIQLRVAAQGTAVGCLTLGMTYHMVKDFFPTGKKE